MASSIDCSPITEEFVTGIFCRRAILSSYIVLLVTVYTKYYYFYCSNQNNSDTRRYAMISSFNKRKNNPTMKHHHPMYHQLKMLPNSAIMECDIYNSTEDKDFLDPNKDRSHEIKQNDN